MGLTFPTAVFIVLCFVFVARKLLATHHYFICFLAVLPHNSKITGSRELGFLFTFALAYILCFCFIQLPSSWPMSSFPSYLLPCCPVLEGSDRMSLTGTWWPAKVSPPHFWTHVVEMLRWTSCFMHFYPCKDHYMAKKWKCIPGQILCLFSVSEGLKDVCQTIQLPVRSWKSYQNILP